MSDLEERNARAVMQALQQQNDKLNDFQEKLSQMAIQMNMLQSNLDNIRAKHMQDLAAKFGSGPTS